MICRPFDHARRALILDRLSEPVKSKRAPWIIVLSQQLKDKGPLFFFRDPTVPAGGQSRPSFRGAGALRTLARVGFVVTRFTRARVLIFSRSPWGVGFLVFEIFGPGLS